MSFTGSLMGPLDAAVGGRAPAATDVSARRGNPFNRDFLAPLVDGQDTATLAHAADSGATSHELAALLGELRQALADSLADAGDGNPLPLDGETLPIEAFAALHSQLSQLSESQWQALAVGLAPGQVDVLRDYAAGKALGPSAVIAFTKAMFSAASMDGQGKLVNGTAPGDSAAGVIASPGAFAQSLVGSAGSSLPASMGVTGRLGMTAAVEQLGASGGDLPRMLGSAGLGGLPTALQGVASDAQQLPSTATPLFKSDAANGHSAASSWRADNLFGARIELPVGNAQWGSQLGQQIGWISAQGIKAADILLNPPELGPLHVRIDQRADQATVTFTSAHANVREALEQNLPRLRDLFTEGGLQLLDVDVSDTPERQAGRSEGEAGHSASDHGGDDLMGGDDTAIDGVRNAEHELVVRYGLVDAFV